MKDYIIIYNETSTPQIKPNLDRSPSNFRRSLSNSPSSNQKSNPNTNNNNNTNTNNTTASNTSATTSIPLNKPLNTTTKTVIQLQQARSSESNARIKIDLLLHRNASGSSAKNAVKSPLRLRPRQASKHGPNQSMIFLK